MEREGAGGGTDAAKDAEDAEVVVVVMGTMGVLEAGGGRSARGEVGAVPLPLTRGASQTLLNPTVVSVPRLTPGWGWRAMLKQGRVGRKTTHVSSTGSCSRITRQGQVQMRYG